MSIPRAYLPFLESQKLGQLVILPKEIVTHLVGALRLKNGDAVVAFDGRGCSYSTRLVRDKGQWLVQLLSLEEEEKQKKIPHITLLQALPTGDCMDWIMQKATELEVAHIVPIAAKRSVLKLTGERALRRLEHWKNIIIASCEQCGRNTLPLLSSPVSFDAALQSLDDTSLKLLLYPEGDCTLSQLPTQWPHSVVLAVGPEGDWDDVEVATAQRLGFHKLRLGARIMRTDTAAVAATCAILTRWGDFQ